MDAWMGLGIWLLYQPPGAQGSVCSAGLRRGQRQTLFMGRGGGTKGSIAWCLLGIPETRQEKVRVSTDSDGQRGCLKSSRGCCTSG